MEQKNLLLAIILSAIIMVGFQWYSSSQRPDQSQQNTLNKKTAPVSSMPNVPETPETIPGLPTKSTQSSIPVPGVISELKPTEILENIKAKSPRINIRSDRIRGSISLVGAKIDDLVLNNYKETNEKNISLH